MRDGCLAPSIGNFSELNGQIFSRRASAERDSSSDLNEMGCIGRPMRKSKFFHRLR